MYTLLITMCLGLLTALLLPPRKVSDGGKVWGAVVGAITGCVIGMVTALWIGSNVPKHVSTQSISLMPILGSGYFLPLAREELSYVVHVQNRDGSVSPVTLIARNLKFFHDRQDGNATLQVMTETSERSNWGFTEHPTTKLELHLPQAQKILCGEQR